MKVFVFIAVLFVFAHCDESKEVPVDDGTNERVASGVDGITGENLDFVLLTIRFQNQHQKCGGILVHPQWVLTAATCVRDPVEGIASIINATFPQDSCVGVKSKIFIHSGFDQATRANNIALIKLVNATAPDNKTLAIAKFSTLNTTDLYKDKLLRICGFGTIQNYYTEPKKLQCTDLYGKPAADCGSLPNTICTYWDDRESNACASDYGGPLYQYSYNGTKITQTVVGMASFSPDYRLNTPCKGGQKVVHTQTSFYVPWAMNIIASN